MKSSHTKLWYCALHYFLNSSQCFDTHTSSTCPRAQQCCTLVIEENRHLLLHSPSILICQYLCWQVQFDNRNWRGVHRLPSAHESQGDSECTLRHPGHADISWLCCLRSDGMFLGPGAEVDAENAGKCRSICHDLSPSHPSHCSLLCAFGGWLLLACVQRPEESWLSWMRNRQSLVPLHVALYKIYKEFKVPFLTYSRSTWLPVCRQEWKRAMQWRG